MSESKPKYHPYPLWSPRFWHGMGFVDWIKLAASHGFRIHPFRMPMAFAITVTSIANSALGALQWLIFNGKIRATKLDKPPVFIIGHWRSGTTHLHELMVRDPRFAFPTTWECCAPHHCLLTHGLAMNLGWWLLPKKRPMDNMATSWDRPQEDEFALCSLGSPTPYRRMAFPNDGPCDQEFLNMENIPSPAMKRWKDDLYWFVQLLSYSKRGKRIILKSPPHTGRIRVLAEMFPGAKFVHIVRDPHSVFPSTRRLWRSLDEVQGLQLAKHEGLDDFVFDSSQRMYDGFFAQEACVPEEDLVELKYEDLIANPLEELARIYRDLELGDFEEVRGRLEEYLGGQKDYRTNRHTLSPEDAQAVDGQWKEYMERYGYPTAAERAAGSEADSTSE